MVDQGNTDCGFHHVSNKTTQMSLRLATLGLTLLAASCTTAGPFVTSISSDGNGNLIIEKSMVELNSFTGTVSNKDSTTTKVRLFDQGRLEEVMKEVEALGRARQKPEVWTGN